ncbi:MAG TPA: endonuclease III [Vicinamibacteria bacterium]|nr:endonuclease III [Vicinamibacteria bacterium]
MSTRLRQEPDAPRATPAARARANKILDLLEEAHPEATCALHWRTPYELVMATILSAQCTDERVNMVTPALFARYPDARALAAARASDVERIIRPTGFFRAKAKSLLGCARGLTEAHGGQVPRSMEAMVKLPGVGRKTASVVLGHAYDVAEGIAVDTHVLRVSNRLGIAKSDDPLLVERQLMALIPGARWTRTTDLLIFHGRKVCIARRPLCGQCPVFALCRWEHRQAFALGTPPPPRPRPPQRGARRAR